LWCKQCQTQSDRESLSCQDSVLQNNLGNFVFNRLFEMVLHPIELPITESNNDSDG
jgi:hypothetical protein